MNKFVFSVKEIDFFRFALLGLINKTKEPIANILYHKLNDNCLISLTEEEINCLKNAAEKEHEILKAVREYELKISVNIPSQRKAAITTANYIELAAIAKLNNVQLSIF